MSGRGVTIPIAADATEAIRASKQTAGALDDVVDELDKVDRAGATAATPATKGLDKAGAQAADTTRTLRSTRDALGDLETAGHAVGDPAAASMGRVRKSTDDAGEGIKAFKENAQSNLKETAASFTDVDSAIGGMQGFLAEALEGLGAVGVAAGAGIATGLGLAQAALQATADKVNATAEAAAQLAQTDLATPVQSERMANMRTQLDGVLFAVKDARSWWEVWQDSAVTGADQIAKAAEEGSTSAGKFVEAFNTDDPVTNLHALQAALADSRRRVNDLTVADSERFAQTRQFDNAAADRIATEKTMQATIADSISTAQKQVEIEQAVATAHGQTIEQYRAATAAEQAHTDAVTAGTQAMHDAADPVDVYTAAVDRATAANQSGVVSVQDLIDTWVQQAKDAAAFETNLQAIGAMGGQALADSLRAKGPEVAGATAAAIAGASPAQQQQAIAAYAAATGTAAGQAIATGVTGQTAVVAKSVQDLLNAAARGVVSPVLTFRAQLDTGQVDAEMRRLANTPGTIEYKARIGQKGVM